MPDRSALLTSTRPGFGRGVFVWAPQRTGPGRAAFKRRGRPRTYVSGAVPATIAPRLAPGHVLRCSRLESAQRRTSGLSSVVSINVLLGSLLASDKDRYRKLGERTLPSVPTDETRSFATEADRRDDESTSA